MALMAAALLVLVVFVVLVAAALLVLAVFVVVFPQAVVTTLMLALFKKRGFASSTPALPLPRAGREI